MFSKFLFIFILLGLLSCNKFLNEKAVKEQFVPATIEDLQAMLDSRPRLNQSDPILPEMLSDEYYITTQYWGSLTPEFSLNYIWAADAVPQNNSWSAVYQGPIYYSNIALDYLSELDLTIDENFNRIKGSALFYRANAFFNIAQVFALPYDESNLSDLGIVLRTTSDINAKSTRATIKETYEKIITDLKEALDILPNSTRITTRPTKASAQAALARVYLTMRDYNNAEKYADLCLKVHDTLLDFNNLTPGIAIQSFNPEVIFHSRAISAGILAATNAKIDTVLLASYHTNDLRKSIFFRPNTGANAGSYAFRGSFNGTESAASVFTGTTTAEMLLIRAECYARKGNKEKAIDDLNTLLAKRMDNDSWIPIDYLSVNDPLSLILSERRKELVFRGIRWMDLRRLNMEGANITLKRIINNTEYTLSPNDKRWIALIPYDVINRAGIEQNPR